MKIVTKKVGTSKSTKAASAGNQKRIAVGASGTQYDMSWVAKSANSADLALGDKMCAMTVEGNLRATANNIDERTAAEKLFNKGGNVNFGFSVYGTKEQEQQFIDACAKLELHLAYRLSIIESMNKGEMDKAREELKKMYKVRALKKVLKDDNLIFSKGEWEAILRKHNIMPKQFGINTVNLSVRASTRDTDLYVNENNAGWAEREVEDGGSMMMGLFNAAGKKSLPIFDKRQMKKAHEQIEDTYKKFEKMWKFALEDNNAVKYDEIFNLFVECCNELTVPDGFKKSYLVFDQDLRESMDRDVVIIADMVRAEYKRGLTL